MSQPKIIDLANAPKPSDAALVQKYRESQDRSLLGDLYRKHMSLVFGVCMYRLGDKHEAQKATMDIFERLLTTAEMPDGCDFRTYLFALTDHHCTQVQRDEKLTPIQLSCEEVNAYELVHPIDGSSMNKKEFDRASKVLDEAKKHLLESFYVEQKSYDQIARAERTTIPAVKSMISQAKQEIQI